MFPCSHPISRGFPSQPPPVAVGSCQQDNATLLACLLPELRDGNRGGGISTRFPEFPVCHKEIRGYTLW